nr:IFT27 [synthetic construct]
MVNLRLQVAVVGAPTVGKKAFVQMLHSNGTTFPKNYLMTLGCDFIVKEVPVDDDNTVEMIIFDVSGQREYEPMVSSYLQNTAVFIVMYDVSNKVTFEACARWVNQVRTNSKESVGILIANKSDLSDKAEVTDRQGKDLANANKMKFYKISTLRGVGITEPIDEIARHYVDAYQKRIEQLTQMR